MASSVEPGAPQPLEAPAESHELRDGWEVAGTAPDAVGAPGDLDALTWLPARVPGTVAAALSDAGRGRAAEPADLDSSDWWFRTRFASEPPRPHEHAELVLEGLATLAEVYLNGVLVLTSTSMFVPHRVDVRDHLREENVLTIGFRALAPLLARSRRPRARWRTRVADGNLRFLRTSLLGRAPGFAPGPAPVGPWRPVRLERRRHPAVEALELRPGLDGDDGVLRIRALLRPVDGDQRALRVDAEVDGPSGCHRGALDLTPDGDGVRVAGTIRIPQVERWWPHTHGTPSLHDVRLCIRDGDRERSVAAGRTGFRSFSPGPRPGHDVESDGLDPHVNGQRVFARGAVWTPADPVALTAGDAALRAQLEHVRDAGMNLLRVPGIGTYEDERFHALCDELGLMVWQDLMFANFDYPDGDADFRAQVEAEAHAALGRIAGRPSTVVVCGGSEVEQQAAMFGVDPAIARTELFARRLPEIVASADPALTWVPSAPCGGDLPFRPSQGVANYFGVGAYGLPLEDARRAGVRFASECLAFANVPDERGADAVAPGTPARALLDDPRWKAGVPRDVGASWDFEDVRDRYLALLFGEDPAELRRTDPERYLELSRATSGEVMAEVMGEWRRAASPCGGGVVLWLRDLLPGAGWGVLDHEGRPKPAYHHLRRALAPIAVWMSDEQLGGLAVHAANDGAEPLDAQLRVALYARGEHRTGEAIEPLALPPHGAAERNVEAMLGHFVDASWAYRFGPPGHDVVVASLETPDGALLSQALRFPAGRPREIVGADDLGLVAEARPLGDGRLELTVRTRRLAYGLRIHATGMAAGDDAFCVEPGGERTVVLTPDGTAVPEAIAVSALNLEGRVQARPTGVPA